MERGWGRTLSRASGDTLLRVRHYVFLGPRMHLRTGSGSGEREATAATGPACLAGRRSLPLETRLYVARIAPLLQSERMFAAVPLQAGNAPAGVLQPPRAGREELDEVAMPGPAANPFARPEQPAHDLFAPASTVSSQ